MSVARDVLKLPQDSDDYALIGVGRGSTRTEIVDATQARIQAVATCSQYGSRAVMLAQQEIREASQRLVNATDKIGQKISSHASPVQFGSIAAAVLMRRNPRLAHLYLARMKVDAERSSPRVTNDRRPASNPVAVAIVVAPDESKKVPWLLAVFVALSLTGLIAEVLYLRSQMQAEVESEESMRSDEAESDSREGTIDSVDRSVPDGGEATNPMPRSSAGVDLGERAIEQPDLANPAPESMSGTHEVSASSAAARALRNRWQRVARTTVEIPIVEVPPVVWGRFDPLDESLRQCILLERLVALDLIARELESGNDRSASLLFETISNSSSIGLTLLPPIAGAVAQEFDGELAKALQRLPGSSQGRIALLRNYRTRPSSPGRLDAQTLIQEALKGPSRGSRTIAQGILIDRGVDALEVLVAVEERFSELAGDPALAGFLRALSGVDPNAIEGPSASRAAMLRRIIAAHQSRVDQLDSATKDIATILHKIAVKLRIRKPPDEVAELLRSINPKDSTQRMIGLGGSDDGVLQLLVHNGTALLRDQAAVLGARRPPDERIIERVVSVAARERADASTALGQAIVNARGMLGLDAILLGVSGLQQEAGDIESENQAMGGGGMEWDAPMQSRVADPWRARLEALSPTQPAGYLELAEEVADYSQDAQSRMLARQLFSLAGGLDPDRLGASAALGIKAIEDQQTPEGRVAALRWMASSQRWSHFPRADESQAHEGVVSVGSAVRLGAVEALVQYRRGFGRRAIERIKKPQVREYFESIMRSIPGGIEEFDRLSAVYVSGDPPPLSPETMMALLRLEHALLSPKSTRWSDALAIGRGGPTYDAPLGTAEEVFGVDSSRNRWTPSGWAIRDRDSPATGAK